MNRLLSVLELGGPAADAAWRFLMRLPTNPEMLEGVRRLETFRSGGVIEKGGGVVGEGGGGWGQQDGGRGREGWQALLGPPGSHRMLYTLQIVDGVLDFVMAWDGDSGGGDEGGGGGGGGRREWEVCLLVDSFVGCPLFPTPFGVVFMVLLRGTIVC